MSTSVTTAAPTPSSAPATVRSTSAIAQETTDRKAVETLWSKYLVIADTIVTLPTAAARQSAMSPYAVSPVLQRALTSAAIAFKAGQKNYGTDTIVHRITWPQPIAGKNTAVMYDCTDDYNSGSMDIKTGQELTGGLHRDNTRITAVRQSDGSWKVYNVEYLVKITC